MRGVRLGLPEVHRAFLPGGGALNAPLAGFGRILVLGHSGLIGGRILALLRRENPGLEVLGRSIRESDLTRPDEAEGLAGLLEPSTGVVACSGIKPQVANDLGSFERNVAMVANLCRLLERRPVRRLVYFSSAAVYGEESHDTAIREDTPARPSSYYGIAKHASELLLRRALSGRPGSSLAVLRPPLVYGPGDPAESYGPSLFAAAALRGERIRLWGEGDELREFLFVEDAARLACQALSGAFEGILNAASGRSYTFREVLDELSAILGRKPLVESRPRSRRKVDNAFDNSLLRSIFPGFAFTGLGAGLERTVRSLLRGARPADLV